MPQTVSHQLRLSYARLIGTKYVSAPDGLMTYGPTVKVSIGVHDYFARSLMSQGKPVPSPITGDAMIDTGATSTTISIQVAKALNLSQSGIVQSFGIGGASTGFRAACTVDIKGLRVGIPRAHCHELPKSAGLVALIGRDILRHMKLHYDGVNGEVTLSFPGQQHTPKHKHKPNAPQKRKRKRR